MNVRVVRQFPNRQDPKDDHPYRTGAHKPTLTEVDADGCDVVHGEIPKDLEGVYLRNTENPLLPSLGRYHPFDGDGMIHAMHFHDGKADYRNRVVDTEGLRAELIAGEPLFAGIIEPPAKSKRDGWGARTRLKDASSTDVLVHNGLALSLHYQCGEAYQLDPVTLEARGAASWAKDGVSLLDGVGVSAHAKTDPRTGELLFFNYRAVAPYFHLGTVDPHGKRVHHTAVALPGPRLPHDLAFTERFVIVGDFPFFWDDALLAKGVYRAKYHPEMPSRFGVVPRRGDGTSVRWFDAGPTYVLHWVNAYEEGDEVVLEGFHQESPCPMPEPGDGPYSLLGRTLDMHVLGTHLHRWRFNLETGKTKEERLDDRVTEFPTIHGDYQGKKHRFVYATVGAPGGFLFSGLVRYDMKTGAQQRHDLPAGVFASEAPMAPRTGATEEGDGYVVTFTSDVNNDLSECVIFDASALDRGPLARVRLPHRIASGTHACWAPTRQ
jgi:carotenoid cleavage dioxygenase-like enzyme